MTIRRRYPPHWAYDLSRRLCAHIRDQMVRIGGEWMPPFESSVVAHVERIVRRVSSGEFEMARRKTKIVKVEGGDKIYEGLVAGDNCFNCGVRWNESDTGWIKSDWNRIRFVCCPKCLEATQR